MNFLKSSKTPLLLKNLLNGVVEASLAVVETNVMLSKISKSTGRIFDLVNSTASATEEMVATVKGIAGHAQEASTTAVQTAQDVTEAITVMEEVNTKMATTSDCMKNLQSASSEIQIVLETINAITEQTNLLALNASIEAARAGDAGKGFAVVADEVRKLAGQSQKATKEIGETISGIQSEIEQVHQAVQQSQSTVQLGAQKVSSLRESANQIDTLMQNIAHSTQEQSEASQQISHSIVEISEESRANQEDIEQMVVMMDNLTNTIENERMSLANQDIPGKVIALAQADHALWKKKVVDFEMGRIDLDPDAIGDHKTCRLGKWYYDDASSKYGKEPAFKNMENPHIAVHKAATEAARRRKADPGANILDCVQKLEEASHDVVANLKELDK